MDALKAKNAQLKKELAKLEKLAASLEKKDSAAKAEQKAKDVSDISRAFEHYDADGSGFIDRDEFAGLCSDLGETLDDKELAAAVKAIDTSGDGKISLNEFVRWFTTDKKPAADKSAAKIAAIKLKLRAKQFKAAGTQLMRQLSAVKKEDTECVSHRIMLNLGTQKAESKAAVKAFVDFTPTTEKGPSGAESWVCSTFAIADGASDASVAALKKAIDEVLASTAEDMGMPSKSEYDMKTKTFKVTAGVPEDPFAMASQLGIDLSQFVKEFSVAIDLPFDLNELIDVSGGKVADIIALRFETKLNFRKALVSTIAAAIPGDGLNAYWGAFLENFNFSANVGSIKDLLVGCQPPAGLQLDRQPGIPPGMIMMAQAAEAALAPGSKQQIAELWAKLWKKVSREKILVDMANHFRVALAQPTSVHFHSASGIGVTVQFKNFLPFKAIPSGLVHAPKGGPPAKTN